MYISNSKECILYITSSLDTLPNLMSSGTVVTWGTFDGVHLGHQRLISALKETSKRLGLPSALITFNPRPSDFFLGDKAPKALMDSADKKKMIEILGIDCLIELPFDENIALMDYKTFIKDVIVDKLNAKSIVLGHDASFGSDKSGTFNSLSTMPETSFLEFSQVEPYKINGQIVASTIIRNELASGRLENIPPLLGRRHSVHGEVLHGMSRGKSLLGFPTANLDPGKLLLPPNGVYSCLAVLDGKCFPAACNIGFNPSFGNDSPSLEAHIIGLDDNIYGTDLRIYFMNYLRSEKNFDSMDDLKEQITADVNATCVDAKIEMAAPNFSSNHPL